MFALVLIYRNISTREVTVTEPHSDPEGDDADDDLDI